METHYILVAEDDGDDQMLFNAALKECSTDFIVNFFANGEQLIQFLDRLLSVRPCCIFLDLNMPKMDGLETLRCIKDHEQLRNIPVVMLSTSNNPSEIDTCRASGAFDFLVKPETYGKLVAMIKEVLSLFSEKPATNIHNDLAWAD